MPQTPTVGWHKGPDTESLPDHLKRLIPAQAPRTLQADCYRSLKLGSHSPLFQRTTTLVL